MKKDIEELQKFKNVDYHLFQSDHQEHINETKNSFEAIHTTISTLESEMQAQMSDTLQRLQQEFTDKTDIIETNTSKSLADF